MAADSSTAATSSRSGGGGASADSYIGSLISLTSKSEIRYEGILYNINTEESSIGLRNVRSFGTEGRNKDGPQVPPSDKIYEYILFRGTDIKDLQVKASPPVQSAPPINNDPAIIQSQYTRPTSTTPPPSLPTAPSSSLTDHGAHSGLPGSNFQSALPLYQPGGNLNSWGPSPPQTANGSGLAMPMYWQGFYGAPNGLPQLPQQTLLRPPPGLSMAPSMQQMQFSGFNPSLPTAGSSLPTSNLADYHALVPNASSSLSLTSSLPASSSYLNIAPIQPVSLVSETMNNLLPNRDNAAISASPPSSSFPSISHLPNKDPVAAISTSPPSSNFPSISHLPNKDPIAAISASAPTSSLPSLSHFPTSIPDNLGVPLVSSKPSPMLSTSTLQQQTLSRHGTSVSVASAPVLTEAPTPSLITPGHLLSSGPATASAPQTLQTVQKDVEVVQVSSKPLLETPAPVVTEAHATESQPPILPLPSNSQVQKPNGGAYHARNYRGRGGRGSRVSRLVTKFTEDFDFMAMNEKFNKDEVWGHLGKCSKSKDKEGNVSGSDEDDSEGEDSELPKIEVKHTYNKDDFFDSLSCNALDNDSNHGRTRYSEQMKLDSETFGDISRYRGGRGRGPGHGGGRGRGPGRGGGRHRGSYHGRGYGGYGYSSRGRGRGIQNRAS